MTATLLPLAVALWFVLGWPLARVLDPGATTRGERAAHGLLLGTAATSAFLLALTLLGVPFAAGPLLAFTLVGAALCLALERRLGPPAAHTPTPLPATSVRAPLLLLIALCGAATLGTALVLPLANWDAFVHWGFKARVFHEDAGLGPYLRDGARYQLFSGTHPSYPPLVPLAMDAVYLVVGERHEPWGKVYFPLCHLATLALVFGCGARRLGASFALWLTAFVATAPMLLQWAPTGLADVPLGLAVAVATLSLAEWLEGGARGKLRLGIVALGAAAFTKNEGMAMFAIGLGVVASGAFVGQRHLRGQWREALFAFAAVGLLFVLPWALFRRSFDLPQEDFARVDSWAGVAAQVARVPQILSELFRPFSHATRWGIFWWVVLPAVSFGLWRGTLRTPFAGACLAMALGHLGAVVAGHAASRLDVHELIGSAGDRLFLHTVPVWALLAGLALRPHAGEWVLGAGAPGPSGPALGPTPEGSAT